MAVALEHPLATTLQIDDSFATVTDLERVVPCVEGGSVLETTRPSGAPRPTPRRRGE
jgi:hypothetical protein